VEISGVVIRLGLLPTGPRPGRASCGTFTILLQIPGTIQEMLRPDIILALLLRVALYLGEFQRANFGVDDLLIRGLGQQACKMSPISPILRKSGQARPASIP
jgi:hypothetical protein